jgi:CRP-like cAMP-binding protein
MKSLRKLIDYLKEDYPFLKKEDIKLIIELISCKSLKAGDFFVKFEDKSNKMFFVQEGLFKAFFYDKNYNEVIIDFYKEGDLSGDWQSTLLGQPSQICIQAIEDSYIVQIDTERLSQLMRNNLNLSQVYNQILKDILIHSLHNIKHNMNEKPKERYIHLIEDRPYLFNRVPQKEIAAYLGITPVSLSRLKRRVTQNTLAS